VALIRKVTVFQPKDGVSFIISLRKALVKVGRINLSITKSRGAQGHDKQTVQ
jgi:hypothetical protein